MVSNNIPIALLCTVIKIFEKVAYKYIFNFLVDNSLIYEFQSGFMHGHSKAHQLIELTHEIMQSLDNQELICLIVCDVSKAFDRVWLRGLLLELERYSITGNLLRWLESYISHREQQVIIKDSISLKGNIKSGVPQWSTIASLVVFVHLLMILPMICLDCADCLLMTRPVAREHLKLIICVLWLTLI